MVCDVDLLNVNGQINYAREKGFVLFWGGIIVDRMLDEFHRIGVGRSSLIIYFQILWSKKYRHNFVDGTGIKKLSEL